MEDLDRFRLGDSVNWNGYGAHPTCAEWVGDWEPPVPPEEAIRRAAEAKAVRLEQQAARIRELENSLGITDVDRVMKRER